MAQPSRHRHMLSNGTGKRLPFVFRCDDVNGIENGVIEGNVDARSLNEMPVASAANAEFAMNEFRGNHRFVWNIPPQRQVHD